MLGPGGVGGLVAAVLAQDGARVSVVARESTCQAIAADGLRLRSVRFGELVARPAALPRLSEEVDVLVIATNATGLLEALERIDVEPPLVVPLLNGLDHLGVLRERFDPRTVAAAVIRVEADRPQPGVIVHTSPFLRVDIARTPFLSERCESFAAALDHAGVPVVLGDSEPDVMWGKLVRLNALACTTSAYDTTLGPIRDTPELRAELIGAIEEASAVARAEGAGIEAATALGELSEAHAGLGSSMQRDIAAGRTPELDAIPGAVLRAGARHGIACPTIERLSAAIARHAGVPAPTASA